MSTTTFRDDRAAILPLPGDPFLFTYWLHNFHTFWADEIGKLYIILNTPAEPVVVDYITKLCASDSRIDLTVLDQHIQHGDAINMALDKLTEKYIMLVEDDAYIFKKGIVTECFELLESGQYDIVGSKRGSCSTEIMQRAQDVWGISYDGEGDQGPNFWPSYFFSRADTLRRTDRNFNSRAWKKGERILALNDYEVAVPLVVGDTFVNTSLQLHAMIPEERIKYIPQYHAHPEDVKYFNEKKYLFDGKAPWTHIGSLSSGFSGVLMDQYGRSLSKRLREAPKGHTILPPEWCDVTAEGARKEWERRIAWWDTFAKFYEGTELEEIHDLYNQAIVRVIEQYHLSTGNIRSFQRVYKTLGL